MLRHLWNYAKKLRNTSPTWALFFRVVRSPIYKAIGISAWFRALPHSIFGGAIRKENRRILMIYDLSTQPFSVGDILTFQEAGLVLLEKYGCSAVDFALVYNPVNPAVPDPSFSSINEDNCLFHLASILPVAQVNPRLGSLFLFNNHDYLNRFVIDNMNLYFPWPSAWMYFSKEYLSYRIFNELLAEYYQKNNRLPVLNSRPNVRLWVFNFMRKHIFPSIPVTVQLRRNFINDPRRNSDYDVWFKFFSACNGRYPVKFIIIGSEAEMDERFKNCPNVCTAKDFRTGVEQDLALIESAVMHMGASSGPGMLALFGSKPFLLLNSPLEPLLTLGFTRHGNFAQAFFSSPVQQYSIVPETLDLLNEEFEKMWAAVDKEFWDKIMKQPLSYAPDTYTWLR